MKRRTVLATAAAIASGFGGCTSADGADDDGGDPSTPTETPAETPTESPRTSGAVTETTFTIVESACGSGTDAASIDHGAGHVTVRGTILGRDACYTAALQSAAYDTSTGELTVDVRSFSNREGNLMCAQCIVEFDYRARISYGGPDPNTVTVRHNGETV